MNKQTNKKQNKIKQNNYRKQALLTKWLSQSFHRQVAHPEGNNAEQEKTN